ncbi:MAG: hydroxylamine reductase, partial [Deltaproteobacteria bacterium]|nr:hydroxylamine reductase [Candidatus Anaeroferrophillacea bacterium]
MFCFQCQETAKNQGCAIKGVCGKPEDTANLQDLLIHVLKGIAVYGEKLGEMGITDRDNGLFVAKALFATITNAGWDNDRFIAMIREGLTRRDRMRDAFMAAYRKKHGSDFTAPLPDAATWRSDNP